MENQVQEVQVVESKDSTLYLLTKAEVDVQIATAKAFPRSLKTFMDKAKTMATLTEDIAASCCYAVPRSGKHVEGKSIRLAEIALASYGNVHSAARLISNNGKVIVAQGVCWDLETNNRITKEVTRKITNAKGVTYSEDMQILTGNAACSIALRNAVFATIPSALTDEVYDKCKEVARGTAETLTLRRNKAMEYFKGVGVTEKQIFDVLEIKGIDDIDLDKLQLLTGMRTAIKNGETTVKALFEPAPTAVVVPLEDLQMLFDMKKEFLNEMEVADAERILNEKVENSYNKLHALLKSK